MVPDKFNMVDMGGIDLLESQGLEIEGLYDKLVESITLCRYTILYNWKFDGVEIPPSYFELEIENNTVSIGDYVSITNDDVLHIYTIEIVPNIVPISITENGVFSPPEEVDGYSPVTVNVEPVIQPLSVTGNGTYTASGDVEGYSPVVVNVPVSSNVFYSSDGTLAVEIDRTNKRLIWYFMGFTKGSSDVSIPPEVPLWQDGLIYSTGYDSDKTTQIGQIGFYSGNIRSWSTDTSSLMAGTFWGVVYSDGGTGQTNPYVDPPV